VSPEKFKLISHPKTPLFSHKKWLELRAKPRKLPKPSMKSFRCPESKISEENLRRILNLSKPKWRKFYINPHCHRAFNRYSIYDPVSERTYDLSQPRATTTSNQLECCKSILKYQGTKTHF
jgi:hypothetical protein